MKTFIMLYKMMLTFLLEVSARHAVFPVGRVASTKNDAVISTRFASVLNKETIFHLHHESTHCSFKVSLPPTRLDPQS